MKKTPFIKINLLGLNLKTDGFEPPEKINQLFEKLRKVLEDQEEFDFFHHSTKVIVLTKAWELGNGHYVDAEPPKLITVESILKRK